MTEFNKPTQKDWDALAEKQVAAIKRAQRETLEDATVRAAHKVMAEKAVDVAMKLEREACAKLAEEYGTWGGSGFNEWFKKLAAEIRARGEA